MKFLKINNKNWIKLCKGELKAKQLEIDFKKSDIKDNRQQKIKNIDDLNNRSV